MDVFDEANNFLNESDANEIPQNIMQGVKAGAIFEDMPGMRTKVHLMEQKNRKINRDPKETIRRFLSGGI